MYKLCDICERLLDNPGEYGHTQLPWDDYVAKDTTVYIDSPENPNACKNIAMLTGPDAKANAAFIKKACNSYYEMLRALRTIQKELDDKASWDKCGSAYQRITEAIAIAEEDE